MISEYKKRKLRQKFLCDKSLLRKKTDLISEGKIQGFIGLRDLEKIDMDQITVNEFL